MPHFTVRTVNSAFFTSSYVDLPQVEDALEMGVRGALSIASDEVAGGPPVSVVEVLVAGSDGEVTRRVAVTVSVAPLALRSDVQLPLPGQSNDL